MGRSAAHLDSDADIGHGELIAEHEGFAREVPVQDLEGLLQNQKQTAAASEHGWVRFLNCPKLTHDAAGDGSLDLLCGRRASLVQRRGVHTADRAEKNWVRARDEELLAELCRAAHTSQPEPGGSAVGWESLRRGKLD